MKIIGKILFFLSFIIGGLLLIASFAFGFGRGHFSDDFWFWLIAAIVSFGLLFFAGKYLGKESNNKKEGTSKAHALKTIASFLFMIGIILSIMIIILSFQTSTDGGFGLFVILPIVFGLFFVLGVILLLIHQFINRK